MMLTAARLREQLSYDPLTGVFRWKVRRSQMQAGDIAGSQTRRGLLIRIDDRLYKGRRLAWLYMKGTWPKHVINCRNGNPSDIRWVNIRQITQTQRQASTAPYGKLGVKGVWATKGGKFVAEIRVAGQKKYLGSFDTIKEANAAYAEAAKQAFGNFARAR
jgi:hypothetical protein